MSEKDYEKLYEWDSLKKLFAEFLPEIIDKQETIREQGIMTEMPPEAVQKLKEIGFSNEPKKPEEVARQVIDSVYLYTMKTNHPRNFAFIPDNVTPYSIMGDVINSLYNPHSGGVSVTHGTAILEKELISWMGSLAGYDKEDLGGQFVSGGSTANLTGMIVARDDKLTPDEFHKGTIYISDQTHSSLAKAVHIMGLPRSNVRIIPTDKEFRMKVPDLEDAIKEDIKKGFKPFLLIGTAGTTNTGAIDPLIELADLADKYQLWYHIDGAYGASILLSSQKELLNGIERSDSLSWDAHKLLFQTYGCAAIICKDRNKMVRSFHVNPEYLNDVASTEEDVNFWDIGIELTRPARSMRLWFTLQTVGTDVMKSAIDQAFVVADWLEEEVNHYSDFEIISHSKLGIINFRYINDRYTEAELDTINHEISQQSLKKDYAAFLTTELNGKKVLRFCANHPLTTQEEIKNIMADIRQSIDELTA